MAEEPTLPRLLAVSWNEQSQSFSTQPRKRARHPRSGGLYNSSDPAVFSSDDDPGLDNYVKGRRKKRYVGTWFQQQPTSSDSTFSDCSTLRQPKRERKLVRQVDSGVYLGPEGSDGVDGFQGSDDLVPEELELPVQSALPSRWEKRPAMPVLSKAELLAREKVQACLEQGNETIDLWSMGLEELSNETLSPLANFSCIPVVAKDVAFEQKEPELNLFLAMNRLRLVPGALFDLQHLTGLSLRGNKLSEIPPAIGKLSNLKRLNVSQNRLRTLPAELVQLFDLSLRNLWVHPNPFLKPDSPLSLDLSDEDNWQRHTSTEERLTSRFLGRSPLQVSDTMGRPVSVFKIPIFSESNQVAVAGGDEPDGVLDNVDVDVDEVQVAPKPSRVPSLVELALRSCYSTNELSQLSHYIPEGLSHLRDLLARAMQQKETGGLYCSTCQKLVVMPAIEWVEWRDICTVDRSSSGGRNVQSLSHAEDERPVPFLHRACSWQCGPGNTWP
ncbi:hypothetical protein E4U59_004618 [Claviceps monticola]|nr:hypothetical protein E4U59_004618 [Claviceps monticola]